MISESPNGLYCRSLAYLQGKRIRQDFAESFALNAKAAREGHHDAVLAMGWYYLNGVGVERNHEQAKKWYRTSARQGDSRAMFSLGQIACNERDFTDAFKWFSRAVDHGHARSLYWLGKIHWRGNGVPHDKKQAMRLFHLAATKKVTEAQRFLRFLGVTNGKRAKQ